jgi:hypothetical protein
MNDLRFAVRQLLKSPGFTCIALLTLSLGIGANTAIFSVVNAILLRPLPFPKSEQLVAVWETNPQSAQPAQDRNEVAAGNFFDWRAHGEWFDGLSALYYTSLNFTGTNEPERIQGAFVTTDLFQTLGVQPALGRNFSGEEKNIGAEDRGKKRSAERQSNHGRRGYAAEFQAAIPGENAGRHLGASAARRGEHRGSQIALPLRSGPAEKRCLYCRCANGHERNRHAAANALLRD